MQNYFVALFSTDIVNADDKLLKQQPYEELWWYYTSGALGPYSISPVFSYFQQEQEM